MINSKFFDSGKRLMNLMKENMRVRIYERRNEKSNIASYGRVNE